MYYYLFLNYFFFIFHTMLIIFNTFGWIVKKARRLNLISLLVTAISWFGLGMWYGWGYCFCTDLHWMVRQHLGYHDTTNSYIQFLILKLIGINPPQHLTDIVTASVFFLSLTISIIFNVKDYRSKIYKK
jgi:hypothetical protein